MEIIHSVFLRLFVLFSAKARSHTGCQIEARNCSFLRFGNHCVPLLFFHSKFVDLDGDVHGQKDSKNIFVFST